MFIYFRLFKYVSRFSIHYYYITLLSPSLSCALPCSAMTVTTDDVGDDDDDDNDDDDSARECRFLHHGTTLSVF